MIPNTVSTQSNSGATVKLQLVASKPQRPLVPGRFKAEQLKAVRVGAFLLAEPLTEAQIMARAGVSTRRGVAVALKTIYHADLEQAFERGVKTAELRADYRVTTGQRRDWEGRAA